MILPFSPLFSLIFPEMDSRVFPLFFFKTIKR